ncbi:HTTM domain-containing protein [Flavobacteriales bacterium]|nr:HTTM domain-containing protein [Flavobacteriales bacterium]
MELSRHIKRLHKPFGLDLFQEVSGKSLSIFRIGFGLVMLYEMINLRSYVLRDLLNSKFFLTYDLFFWLDALPRPVMNVVLTLAGFATLFVIVGYKYRYAQLLVAIVWAYLFLLDRGHYNNHYYLYSLICFAMVFFNANSNYSVDAALSKTPIPKTVHAWQIWFIRIQLFIVYFYGAVAKLNADWLRGWPIRKWLTEDIGKFPDWYANFVTSDFGVYFYAYGGIAFDLFIGFCLLHKKLRYWCLPAIIFFHVSNHFFWNIGTFPWFSILVTTLFFDPDWPEKFGRWLGVKSKEITEIQLPSANVRSKNIIAIVFSVYMLIQIVAPLRQFMYPGNPGWHGYGHLFSWRMMLVDSVSGIIVKVKDESDDEFAIVAMDDYISFRQFRKASRVPSSFLDFAHFIRDEMIKGGAQNPVVQMKILKSFNGRPYELLTDTTVNYAIIEESYYYVPDWIEPHDPDATPGAIWTNLEKR